MKAVYQYRIYPTSTQRKALDRQFASHCFVYNQALSIKREALKGKKLVPSYCKLAKNLRAWREEAHHGDECNYSSLQQTLRRLDKAWNRIFHNGAGKPRFKSGSQWRTVEWSTMGDGWGLKDGGLRVQNVGVVKVKWHRELPSQPTRLSITRRNGKYYANFTVDAPESFDLGLGEIGIDWGVKNVASTSDGRSFPAPRPLRHNLKRLRSVDQKLAAAESDASRERLRRIRRSLYEKTRNQRKDFNHKLSRELVRGNCAMALEDLKVSELPKTSAAVRRAYSDVGVRQLISMVKRKAESAGVFVTMVDPAYTSQTCPYCGKRNKFPLRQRTYSCACGYSGDRDVTAAMNILRVGLSQGAAVGLHGLSEA